MGLKNIASGVFLGISTAAIGWHLNTITRPDPLDELTAIFRADRIEHNHKNGIHTITQFKDHAVIGKLRVDTRAAVNHNLLFVVPTEFKALDKVVGVPVAELIKSADALESEIETMNSLLDYALEAGLLTQPTATFVNDPLDTATSNAPHSPQL